MVIVHGEVKPELQRAADEVLSTSQMAKYVEAHPEKNKLAILTECGLVVRMELEHPEKQFYKPCRLCQYMKANDLENVYETLRDEPPERRITVPEDVRVGAARAMLQDDRAGELSGPAQRPGNGSFGVGPGACGLARSPRPPSWTGPTAARAAAPRRGRPLPGPAGPR